MLVVAFCGWTVFVGSVQSQSGPQISTKMDRFSVSTWRSDDAFEDKPKDNFFNQRSSFADFGTLVEDQKQVWTAPSRIRFSDAIWLVPLGGLTAGLFASDKEYSASLSNDPSTIRHYKNVSNAGLGALVGSGTGLYLLSFPKHNPHWRETGLLAGESALNSLMTAEVLRYSTGRARPFETRPGSFFQGGSSFPSEHAAVAWSIAGVIAHEYPGRLPKFMAYSLASAVSFSRVRSRQHFPSDVLVGSALGYLIGQSIYRRRHDPERGGGAWQSPQELVGAASVRRPGFMGSPYVPLDSWVYPAVERLAALGYLKSQSLSIRPWTRSECVRLLVEAGELRPDLDRGPEIQGLFNALSDEFAAEVNPGDHDNVHAQVESVYQQTSIISGRALTDGFHFGQTTWNNYGRPFQTGLNTVTGASAWASAGPFVFYARGEYQTAPTGTAPSPAALDFISNVDDLPLNAPSLPVYATRRFQLLDAYVGMNLANWQLSYGRESLWWGPSAGGTMALSNNAPPLTMFRVNRIVPFRLPGVLGYLGHLRLDMFVGQLTGQEFLNTRTTGVNDIGTFGRSLARQPFLSGARISFKFTPNFEFNLSKTSVYGGPGNPLTATTLVKSALDQHVNGEALGDGRSFVDFSYRLPKLRNWLTAYGEGFTEDEVSPLSKPGKSAWQGGLYAARLPKMNRVDLRIEGGSTSPIDFRTCNGCFYHNFQYVNGYTNDGQLLGTWIGRAAQGELIRSNYWISGSKRVGLELRHRKIDRQFLPQGGTQNEAALTADLLNKSGFRFSGALQYERWSIPLLDLHRQSNVTTTFQLSYWPRAGLK